MKRVMPVAALVAALGCCAASAQDLLTEKKVFELPSYTTVGGQTITGGRGHLDGVLVIQQAAEAIRSFLGN